MNHDKVVNFIDVDLAELVPEEQREELLALHYATIRDALERGRRAGIAEAVDIPSPPEFPPNEIVKETLSLPAVLLLTTLVAVMFATAIILLGAGLS
jgi:hypothetical protein